jgi:hypothetical protein
MNASFYLYIGYNMQPLVSTHARAHMAPPTHTHARAHTHTQTRSHIYTFEEVKRSKSIYEIITNMFCCIAYSYYMITWTHEGNHGFLF